MIRSIYVDNFKAFSNFQTSFSPFTMLIGDNASGKTSLLQAIDFLRQCCLWGADSFLQSRGISIGEILTVPFSKKTITFEVVLDDGQKEIQWGISLHRIKSGLALKNEKVKADGETVLSYNSNKGEESFRLNRRMHVAEPIMAGVYPCSIIRFTDEQAQAEDYPELCFIKRFFSEMEVMDLLSPANMKSISQGKSTSIGSGGEKLASFIKNLSEEELQSLANDVHQFYPTFSAVVPRTKQYGWVRLETKEVFKDKTVEISATNASDGMMRIVALCSIRYLKGSNSAVLLDEIEDGVNNEHFEMLVDLLRDVCQQKNLQIIATTHSSILLDYWVKNVSQKTFSNASEENESVIYLCRNEAGNVEAYDLFSSDQILEKLGYLFPGEIVQSMSNRELQTVLRGEADTE